MRLFTLQEYGHLAWSPVSMQFALATSSANITETFVSETSLSIYSLDTDFTTLIRELSWPFSAEFTCLIWSTNDSIIAGFEDGSLSIGPWNDMGNALRLQAHTSALSALSCSVDYTLPLLATGSISGEISFWDLNTRTLWHAVKSREGMTAHHGAVSQISWNPKVPRICCTASQDGTVSIWDMDKRGGLMSLRGTGDPLVSAIFSPDVATVVFTITVTGVLSMWDLRQKSHPITTYSLQLPTGVTPEHLFFYQYGKSFLCAPTDDSKCFFFLSDQSTLTLLGSSDELGAHINLSPLCPSYFLSQKHDSTRFSSETEGHFLPSLIPLTFLSDIVTLIPSPFLLHPLPLFAETCPDDILDNYIFIPTGIVHINSRNIMVSGSQQQDSHGVFSFMQIRDAGSVLSQIEHVLSLPIESHSCTLPSYKDLTLQAPSQVFRALLSAGSDGVRSWLMRTEASPEVSLNKVPLTHSDGKDFFDDIPSSFPDSFPENDVLETKTDTHDRFSSYYPFLYNNDLPSAAAHAANRGDFGLAFYIAIQQNNKELMSSIVDSFKKTMNSDFIRAVDGIGVSYMSVLDCLPLDQWFYRLKIAAAYGGDSAIQVAAMDLLQKSSDFSPTLQTALTILSGRVLEAFELAASASSFVDILTMAILCVSQGVSVAQGSALHTIEGLLTIIISQGDENLATTLRNKFNLDSTKAPMPSAVHTRTDHIVGSKEPSTSGPSMPKQTRRNRALIPSKPQSDSSPAAKPMLVPSNSGATSTMSSAQIPPVGVPQTSSTASILPVEPLLPGVAPLPQAPVSMIPQFIPQLPMQPSVTPSIPIHAAPSTMNPQPMISLQPSLPPLDSPQLPISSMHQTTPMVPTPFTNSVQSELPVAAPLSITAPAPPTVDGTVSKDVVQVTTTTAPQARTQRRQPTQVLSQGSPLEVIQAIVTNGSANADRFKALVLHYAEVDQIGFMKYYAKLGDCIIHLTEAGVLSADTVSVLGRYIAGLEMRNGQAAAEAIRVMATRKQRLYAEELSVWAAPLKIMARALCK